MQSDPKAYTDHVSSTDSVFSDRHGKVDDVPYDVHVDRDRFHIPSRHEVQTRLGQLAQEHGVNRGKLMLKCDICIILPICLLYVLAFLDRVNMSNANVYGLSKALPLTPAEYYTALTVFFVPYAVLEVPSNYLLKKFKPHVWLSANMLLFGAVSIGQGFVKTKGQLYATRVLLGVFETGMFPGCFYLLSMWYRREEAQKRYSFFFSSTSLAGAFGGLIAYGVHRLDGKRNLSAWRWLFIVEGSITAFFALVLFFCISDFPEDAKFLKDNERAYIKEKLALDSGESYHDQKMEIGRIIAVFKDWKLWITGFNYFGLIVGCYGYAYFAPTIINNFGYSTVKTQVFSIFPWICTFGTSLIVAYFSDLTRHRYLFSLGLACCAVVGFGLLLGADPLDKGTVHMRYAGCFLACTGLYASMPLIVCWANLNFAGHYRRMVGTAWQIGFGNLGGIISVWVFQSKTAPYYKAGYGTCLGMLLLAMCTAATYLFGLMYENKQRRDGKLDAKFNAMSERDKLLAGDKNPQFVYQY